MVSVEGLKTWFDYELLFVAVAIVFMAGYWVTTQLVEYLGSLPLTRTRFALFLTGSGLLVILLLIGLAGRYS